MWRSKSCSAKIIGKTRFTEIKFAMHNIHKILIKIFVIVLCGMLNEMTWGAGEAITVKEARTIAHFQNNYGKKSRRFTIYSDVMEYITDNRQMLKT